MGLVTVSRVFVGRVYGEKASAWLWAWYVGSPVDARWLLRADVDVSTPKCPRMTFTPSTLQHSGFGDGVQ